MKTKRSAQMIYAKYGKHAAEMVQRDEEIESLKQRLAAMKREWDEQERQYAILMGKYEKLREEKALGQWLAAGDTPSTMIEASRLQEESVGRYDRCMDSRHALRDVDMRLSLIERTLEYYNFTPPTAEERKAEERHNNLNANQIGLPSNEPVLKSEWERLIDERDQLRRDVERICVERDEARAEIESLKSTIEAQAQGWRDDLRNYKDLGRELNEARAAHLKACQRIAELEKKLAGGLVSLGRAQNGPPPLKGKTR